MNRTIELILALLLVVMLVADRIYVWELSSYASYEKNHYQNRGTNNQEKAESPFLSLATDIEDFFKAHEKTFIVLSTIAIAWFTGTLWRATTGLQNLAARQAEDTKEALRISDESSKAAQKSVQVSESALKISQRAWLSVQNVFVEPPITTLGVPLNVIVQFKNTGNSPALKIRGVSVSEFMGPTGNPNFNYEKEKVVSIGFAAPGADHNAPNPMDIDMVSGMPKPFTQERVNALQLKLVRYCAHGRIEYEDIFGEHHWFTYCYFLAVPITGQFLVHSEHNDTDDASRQHHS